MIAVQSVLRPSYRDEIFVGLRAAGIPVRQVVLRVPQDVPDVEDPPARNWRQRHVTPAQEALSGLADREPDTIEVDNASRPPQSVVKEIFTRLGLG